MAYSPVQRSTVEKLAIFRACFSGLNHVYGSYDPNTGRAFQVKRPVTEAVVFAHLRGQQPYGVYLLMEDRTRAIAVDFDSNDAQPVLEFARRTSQVGLTTYIERSKRKGYHAWLFASETVPARKARTAVRSILIDMGQHEVEIFPKQDRLGGESRYGNFINAPLSGRLVPLGRTVFLNAADGLKPYPDQWKILSDVRRFGEADLDVILRAHQGASPAGPSAEPEARHEPGRSGFGLPACARKMLQGVESNQRVVCFRLAIHLKRLGVPQALAIALLRAWSAKNRPADSRIIRTDEITAQAAAAYGGGRRSFGCEDPIIAAYCDATCPVRGDRPGVRTHEASDGTNSIEGTS